MARDASPLDSSGSDGSSSSDDEEEDSADDVLERAEEVGMSGSPAGEASLEPSDPETEQVAAATGDPNEPDARSGHALDKASTETTDSQDDATSDTDPSNGSGGVDIDDVARGRRRAREQMQDVEGSTDTNDSGDGDGLDYTDRVPSETEMEGEAESSQRETSEQRGGNLQDPNQGQESVRVEASTKSEARAQATQATGLSASELSISKAEGGGYRVEYPDARSRAADQIDDQVPTSVDRSDVEQTEDGGYQLTADAQKSLATQQIDEDISGVDINRVDVERTDDGSFKLSEHAQSRVSESRAADELGVSESDIGVEDGSIVPESEEGAEALADMQPYSDVRAQMQETAQVAEQREAQRRQESMREDFLLGRLGDTREIIKEDAARTLSNETGFDVRESDINVRRAAEDDTQQASGGQSGPVPLSREMQQLVGDAYAVDVDDDVEQAAQVVEEARRRAPGSVDVSRTEGGGFDVEVQSKSESVEQDLERQTEAELNQSGRSTTGAVEPARQSTVSRQESALGEDGGRTPSESLLAVSRGLTDSTNQNVVAPIADALGDAANLGTDAVAAQSQAVTGQTTEADPDDSDISGQAVENVVRGAGEGATAITSGAPLLVEAAGEQAVESSQYAARNPWKAPGAAGEFVYDAARNEIGYAFRKPARYSGQVIGGALVGGTFGRVAWKSAPDAVTTGRTGAAARAVLDPVRTTGRATLRGYRAAHQSYRSFRRDNRGMAGLSGRQRSRGDSEGAQDNLGTPDDDPFRNSDSRLYDPSRSFDQPNDPSVDVDPTNPSGVSDQDIGAGISGKGDPGAAPGSNFEWDASPRSRRTTGRATIATPLAGGVAGGVAGGATSRATTGAGLATAQALARLESAQTARVFESWANPERSSVERLREAQGATTTDATGTLAALRTGEELAVDETTATGSVSTSSTIFENGASTRGVEREATVTTPRVGPDSDASPRVGATPGPKAAARPRADATPEAAATVRPLVRAGPRLDPDVRTLVAQEAMASPAPNPGGSPDARPNPRLQIDDDAGSRGGGGDRGVWRFDSDSGGSLAPGWVAETVTGIGTRGVGLENLSQSQLADVGGNAFGERPTYYQVRGTNTQQARIGRARALLAGSGTGATASLDINVGGGQSSDGDSATFDFGVDLDVGGFRL